MTDKPLLMSGPMVRATLANIKTQTRRLLKMPSWAQTEGWPDKVMDEQDLDGRLQWYCKDTGCLADLPIGQPGDRFWIKETWGINHYSYMRPKPIPKSRPNDMLSDQLIYFATEDDSEIINEMPRTPSIFMPRWASRLTLTITDVRIQRLQDITGQDCVAEGIEELPRRNWHYDRLFRNYLDPDLAIKDPRRSFQTLWDSLNETRAPWPINPWVVAYTFTTEKRNIDDAT